MFRPMGEEVKGGQSKRDALPNIIRLIKSKRGTVNLFFVFIF
jgi:hypothetical protein